MSYEIKMIIDRKTGEMLNQTIREVDVVINNRPLLELLYEKLMKGAPQ